MISEKQIFSLIQVVNSIQKTIYDRYTSFYWIKAEINKLHNNYKGHCYPEIVQKENGKIIAEMKGIIWKNNFESISKKFSKIVKEPLRDGINVLFLAKIVFHPLYGLSLEISDIDATFSLGEIEKEKRITLLMLKNKGILNKNQLLKFPILPKRLAIISNKSGDGFKDFINKIFKNERKYSFNFKLYEAQLSGDSAVESIIKKLEKIENEKELFDVVLIIRGGGSEVGMSCYNNYSLCEKICLFPIPVMTGIGHASNITVAEMVSYQNAITPSELAEMLINKFKEIEIELNNFINVLISKSKEFINNQQQISLKNQLKFGQIINKLLQTNKFEFLNIKHKLNVQVDLLIKSENNSLKTLYVELKNKSDINIEKNRNLLIRKIDSIPIILKNYINYRQNEIIRYSDAVKLLDPKVILRKGYTISYVNNKIFKSNSKFKIGDLLTTITENYKIKSKIEKIEKSDL